MVHDRRVGAATVTVSGSVPDRRLGGLPIRAAALVRHLPRRLHERSFWAVQAGVLGITAIHLLGEIWSARTDQAIPAGFHHIPVALYLAPIGYASLRYGTEGGLLTGLWSAMLASPNLVLWHRPDYEWASELFFVAVVVAVGVTMAIPVERERRANERLAESERQRLRSYAHWVIQAQEDERRRIARELHDEAAQNIVVIRRGLGTLADDLADHPAVGEVQHLRGVATQTLTGIRRFSRDLRPPTLDRLGLVPALTQLVGEVSDRAGCSADVQTTGEPRRLDPETELAVFRIVQAALHNVENHADATTVDLVVAFEHHNLELTITDDGRGFVVPDRLDELPPEGRLGLVGMNERAQLAGGTLHIASQRGSGTTVSLRVPA
jgi:two-component system, NarL family, sensor histidine kinase DegS